MSKLSCHYTLFCQADDDKISKFSCLETHRCIYNMFSIKFYHTLSVSALCEIFCTFFSQQWPWSGFFVPIIFEHTAETQAGSASRSMFQTSAQHAFAVRQLRHIQHSLSTESATIMYAFVTSRVDYCNVVGAPKSVTSKLQRVLNAVGRVVSGMRKFDRGLMQLLHADLHWLDVPERIKYKVCMMMCRCLDGTAPQYLTAHWAPVSETASWQHLCSAASHQLTVAPHRRVT